MDLAEWHHRCSRARTTFPVVAATGTFAVVDRVKIWVAGVFDRAAPSYDEPAGRYHEYFGERLVDVTGVRSGDAVLDVACGRGAALVPAATRVGSSGTAVGIDLSPEMVRLAGEALLAADTAADVRVMDAEQLEFAASTFTVVLCAFGVFFLPDAGRAVAEMRRVLAPGGVLGVSTWGEEDQRWAWENDLFGDIDVPRRPVVQSFESPVLVEELLAGAGFEDVTVRTEDYEVEIADEDEWWAWKWSYSLRGVLEQLPVERLQRLRHDVNARFEAMSAGRAHPLRLSALLATGRAPR
jgi:SAM-dependent methyltransferase